MLKKILSGLFFFMMSLLLSLFLWQKIIPKEDAKLTKQDFLTQKNKSFFYVAIGDSLTEGVGDVTNQGGFVPLLAESLSSQYRYDVTSANYGISGNTSQQILTRMKQQKAIQEDLKKADLLTVTVGGNDVLAVIRKNLTKLTEKSFSNPTKAYQKRLSQIIELARKQNPDLPIYVVGIYNPFYLNFPDLTEMQIIVDEWNEGTEEIVAEYEDVHFVPINDRLYKGLEGELAIEESLAEETVNDALFEGDHFHPNNLGYQLMSTAIMEKISETKENWTKN